MSNPWDLRENVERLLRFREIRDWRQFHRPKELATALAIEAGELQELFLWRDPESTAAVRQDVERLQQIKAEVADIAIFLLLLAHDLKIDLNVALNEKIAANETRYGAEAHRGIARKADQHL